MSKGAVGAAGGDGDEWPSSPESESSEDNESTLADSSGTSFRRGLDLAMSIAGVMVNSGCVSQQRVSRFHMRQLRFSSLLPFSIDSAHFENTGGIVSILQCMSKQGPRLPLHMPKRFSTFRVSTWRILPASTDSIGLSNLTGIVRDAGKVSERN